MNADRHLLFGLLALQNEFIDKRQLVAAFGAWIADHSKPLDEILVVQQALNTDDRALLSRLVDRHVAARGGNVGASLRSISSAGAVRAELERLADDDIKVSIAKLRSVDLVTVPPSVGQSTSAGQRFEIRRPLDRGGLGIVSVAIDKELNREVALKEIRGDRADDQAFRSKFMLEAEVTGGLEHPGIVPVYGLGTGPDGRPYYAMRLIKGDNLLVHIKRFHESVAAGNEAFDGTSLRKLLRRFLDVCQAIDYAHARGVLHRDLKPGNVMLGKYGETLVVDWGLAKPLGAQRRESSITELDIEPSLIPSGSDNGMTVQGSIIGTAAYAPPEQLSGNLDLVNERSDVYGLGAMLYELLTGTTPAHGETLEAIIKAVVAGQIRTPRSVQPQVPKPLEAICLQSIARQPDARYATAAELGQEIERWLDDQPVHVYPEPLTVRTSRWIRSHQLLVATASAVVFMSTLGLGVFSTIVNRNNVRLAVLTTIAQDNATMAQESRLEAIERYRESRSAIDTWLVGGTDVLRYYPGTESIRKRMLQVATEGYQRIAASPSRDSDLELERARAMIRLGDIHQIQQQYAESRSEFKNAFKVLDGIKWPPSIIPLRDAERANTLTRTGVTYFLEDNFAAAVSAYNEAIRDLESLVQGNPQLTLIERYLAVALINSGELQHRQGELQDAIKSFQSALDRYLNLKSISAVADSSAMERRDRLLGEVRCRELLGRSLQAIGKNAEAEQALSIAFALLNELLSQSPDDPELADAIASLSISRSEFFRTQGLQSAREQSLVAAIEQYKSLKKAMPEVPRFSENLALTLTDLGIAKQDHGFSIEAQSILVEAKQQWQPLLERYGEEPQFHAQSAACEDALAQVVLDATDNADDAMIHAATAVQTYQELSRLFSDQPAYSHRLAVARSHAANIQSRLGNLDNAELLFDSAVDGLRALITRFPEVVPYRYSLAQVLSYDGVFRSEHGKPEESKARFIESIDLWKQLSETRNAEAANELATVLMTCPIDELRNAESALKFAASATNAASQNSRFKTIHAIALVLTNDASAAKKLLDENLAEQGYWVGGDLFAMSILSRRVADGQSNEWLEKGKQWMQANQPGSLSLAQLRDLASAHD